MIFPFSFSGTGTGTFVFSSRFSRRKLCSRRVVLAISGKPRPSPTLFFLSFLFSFFISLFLSFYFAFNRQLPNSKSYLSHKKQVLCWFSRLDFPFWVKSLQFSSSRNSRQDQELFLVPESRCREGDENSFHKNSGNWWEMAGKSWCLIPIKKSRHY
jgi:hypothetical protein